ncbi:MAG TPA: glycine zipper 2TM domain-containing protein [Amaricoccus sp.]|nr:glycine zipper 2TM domain-containing protein [Amaricoccus sp.]
MGRGLIILGTAALTLMACASETSAQKHEVGCVAGTLTGAVIGGLLGSTIGAGTGNVLATTAGAGLGTAAGERLACG